MTKFLIDEDVNQKAVRQVPAELKGFDVLFPEGNFKGLPDASVRKLAAIQERVLVTCDREFSINGLQPKQYPHGVLWFRPPKHSQKRLHELIRRFCAFVVAQAPDSPYDFRGRIYEAHEDRVEISDAAGKTIHVLSPVM